MWCQAFPLEIRMVYASRLPRSLMRSSEQMVTVLICSIHPYITCVVGYQMWRPTAVRTNIARDMFIMCPARPDVKRATVYRVWLPKW